MKGLNKIMLIGNLGKDPEVQTLSGNIKLAKFSLANTETYRDDKRQTHALDDKQGIKRYVTEIIGNQILILDKKEP